MLLRKSKIVTTSVNGLTINVLEKAITINTNKNLYIARHSNMLPMYTLQKTFTRTNFQSRLSPHPTAQSRIFVCIRKASPLVDVRLSALAASLSRHRQRNSVNNYQWTDQISDSFKNADFGRVYNLGM